jgi:hypothetical protein
MAQTPSSPLPPAAAEYETAMHAAPGKLPQVQKWKMFRSSQGETHLDFGKTGLISKPGAMQSILLDHVKREARIVPAPAHPQAPVPSSPQAPGGGLPHLPAPPSALLNVKDLGKQMIGGHPAEGKLYTFQPPKVPAVPGMKGLPGMKGPELGALPKVPGLPQPPGMQPPSPKPPTPGLAPPAVATPAPAPAQGPPPAPGAPHGPVQTLEVWTHAQLKVPLLTKANGMPGLQSSVCKDAKGGEPSASLFQIPPGYKLVEPKPPAPPALTPSSVT